MLKLFRRLTGTDKPERIYKFFVRISLPVDINNPTIVSGYIQVTARNHARAEAQAITLIRRAIRISSFTVSLKN